MLSYFLLPERNTMADFIIKYWVQTVMTLGFTVLTAAVRYLYTQNKRRTIEQEAIKKGIQALLRDSIINQYNKYMDRRYIPIYAMDNVKAMYQEYHSLGGNGTITDLCEELKDLPHRKEDVK